MAIDGHVHGVLTLGLRGGRSGGASQSRSSRTLLEGGSMVVTAVTPMGGRGRTAGWDGFMVPAAGARGILASVSRASMVKCTNGACRVAGGGSLSSVSVSPGVLTPGGAAC